MKKKELYEAPEVECYDVILKKQILQASKFSNKGTELMENDEAEDFV